MSREEARLHSFHGVINNMKRSTLVVLVLGMVGCGGHSANRNRPSAEINNAVSKGIQSSPIPGMAAAVVTSDSIRTGQYGKRRVDGSENVGPGDLWHLGSCAKAFTSTLIAELVEKGVVRWDTKLRDIFPELVPTIRAEYLDVTVEQILQMRGGIVTILLYDDIVGLPAFSGTDRQKRLQFLQYALSLPPENPVGTYAYSNGSYVLAAAIVEKLTGSDWWTELDRDIFKPLGIRTEKIGWPAQGDVHQPFGNQIQNGAAVELDPDDPLTQEPSYLAAAGGISMSIQDYAKFVQMNLRGLRGRDTLVKSATLKRMHTPPAGGFFATGWAILPDGNSYYYGSLELFQAEVAIEPTRNLATIAIGNLGGDDMLVPEFYQPIRKALGARDH